MPGGAKFVNMGLQILLKQIGVLSRNKLNLFCDAADQKRIQEFFMEVVQHFYFT
jgi:hypothetical protein